MTRLAIVAIAALGLTFTAFAGPGPKCPKCKMVTSTKKDKRHPAPVKIGKKTFYCCAACMPKPPVRKPPTIPPGG